MASLIVAGDAAVGDVATGKKFCAGVIYNGVGTNEGGGGDPVDVEILVVGGGGGGGDNVNGRGAGGGAGGLIYIEEYPLAPGVHTVVIGEGGAEAVNGSDTVFANEGKALIAFGGGHGGYNDNTNNGSPGGSGGGQGYPGYAGARATQPVDTFDGENTYEDTGFGNAGGTSGPSLEYFSGGGGAGAAGANWNTVGGPVGGIGKEYSISGTATYYAGGGGAGQFNTNVKYNGGLGGGGRGWQGGTEVEQNGVANTGGGGGAGGSGGSGVVIIRYPTASLGNCTGGTKTTDGTDTVHTFTESGAFTVVAG